MLLLRETKLLLGRSRPAWVPYAKPQNAKLDTKEVLPLLQGINQQEKKMLTLKSKSPRVNKFIRRERKPSYKKKELPEKEIRQLYDQGFGYKGIATRLKKQDIKVSFMTVRRLLAGER